MATAEELPRVGVRLSGGYYFHTLNRLVRDLQPLLQLKEPALCTIDMSRLSFMGPAALALTAATLFEVRDRNLSRTGSEIYAPTSKRMLNYLHRMDFLKLVVDVPDPNERRKTVGFRECRHFVEDEECRKVATDLSQSVQERVNLDDIARDSLETCLVELTENVFFHADTTFGGYAAAQAFKDEIELAIVDLGVGITASLAKNEKYAAYTVDDVTAIKKAMEPTVTATPERNLGHGLAFTQFLLGLNEGRLMVRSGRGLVQVGAKEIERTVDPPLPGTLVAMRVRRDQALSFEKAWEWLEAAIRETIAELPRTILLDDDNGDDSRVSAR